jgi:nucleoid-associated protein
MAIKRAIIHEVRREEDGGAITKNLREEENSVSGMNAKLTQDLIDLFPSSLNFGEFGVDGDAAIQPPFEQELIRFYDDELKCSDFVTMTKTMSNRFNNIMCEPSLGNVKGGYLVFYQYTARAQEWLAVVLLTTREGVGLTDSLDTVSRHILDIDKLHLGATVNLTHWKGEVGTRYLRFKTGLAKDMRDYFEKFIGCLRDKHAATVETKALKEAIQQHSSVALELDQEEAQQRVESAHQFISEKLRKNEPVFLNEVANYVFPESPQEFIEYATENHQVGNELSINKSILRSYQKLSGRGAGISITFDRNMLGSTVIYDNGNLTFTAIPKNLEKQILEEEQERKKQNDTTD